MPKCRCGCTAPHQAPRIWSDKALAEWATPIAPLGVRPGHFTEAEYYAAPLTDVQTYPVYRPDKEPAGYWDWLQRQTPRPLVEVGVARTAEQWIKDGEAAFRALDHPAFRTNDPELIRKYRDLKSYADVWTQPDGTLLDDRWVVTQRGVELTITDCAGCHRAVVGGSVAWGAPLAGPPPAPAKAFSLGLRCGFGAAFAAYLFPGDSRTQALWRSFTTPWDPDPRVEAFRNPPESARMPLTSAFGTFPRVNASPWYMTKIPDLRTLRGARYIDASATHRLRGPEDVARYAALVLGADAMEFGPHKIPEPKQRGIFARFSDDTLYAIGMFVMSLEPLKNPDTAPANVLEEGRRVFNEQGCIRCHVPPNFTNGKLTVAAGYQPPKNHPNRADILNLSVGTDPGLALKTRKATGFCKIPSLRGLWYRRALLHDGSAGSLEEMFDPARQNPDHVPGNWKAPGVKNTPIPGHPFGLGLSADDKAALLSFLRSL